MDLNDKIKSFLIGIVLPLLYGLYSAQFAFWGKTRIRGREVSPEHAVGFGVIGLGLAVCVHAFGFRPYDNYPLIRYCLAFGGALASIISLILEFR